MPKIAGMKIIQISVIVVSMIVIAIWAGLREPAQAVVASAPVATQSQSKAISLVAEASGKKTEELPKKTPEELARIQLRGELSSSASRVAKAKANLAEFLEQQIPPPMPLCEDRYWQDESLKFSMNGRVIEISSLEVSLLRIDGRVIKLLRTKLCKSDVMYLSQRFDDYLKNAEIWTIRKRDLDTEIAAANDAESVLISKLKDEIERQKALAEAEEQKANENRPQRNVSPSPASIPQSSSSFTSSSPLSSSAYGFGASYRSSARDSSSVHTGPRGGRYYINSNGNKTYLSSGGKSSSGGSRKSSSGRRR